MDSIEAGRIIQAKGIAIDIYDTRSSVDIVAALNAAIQNPNEQVIIEPDE